MTTDLIQASWERISQAIQAAVNAHLAEQMPTVVLETFEAQCDREVALMLSAGTVADIFEIVDLSDGDLSKKLCKKLAKLHGEQLDALLSSYLFKIDRDGLNGEVASTISDALLILHALHREWQNPGRYSAPDFLQALWQTDGDQLAILPDLVMLSYAHLYGLHGYYVHSQGRERTAEIWIEKSLSKKPGLMERLETLSQLVQQEPASIMAAFFIERDAVDMRSCLIDLG